MSRPVPMSRRALLTTAPMAGVATVLARPAIAEDDRLANGILRVGCLNVSTYSHLASVWGPIINPGDNDVRMTGMRITHCWDIERDGAEAFARRTGCEAVDRFDGMVGKVDAIINGGYYNHGWNHILHRPYLEAGLPNLINRPLANSLEKARTIVETAKKHGATLMVPSAFEHNSPITTAKKWVQDQRVLAYTATNGAEDYPTHGIHGVYMVFRAIVEAGNPIVAVGYQARSWHSTPGVMTFEHRGADGKPFFGTLDQTGGWGAIRVRVDNAPPRSFEIDPGAVSPYSRTEVWAPTLWEFEKMARQGVMPQTFDQLLNKNNVFLAGWRSVLNEGGATVRLHEVPADWSAPVELPNRPNEETASLFRKEFGPER